MLLHPRGQGVVHIVVVDGDVAILFICINTVVVARFALTHSNSTRFAALDAVAALLLLRLLMVIVISVALPFVHQQTAWVSLTERRIVR
jgi:NADH:ubiquinone oxidoreductase subunit 6 (subunit J)